MRGFVVRFIVSAVSCLLVTGFAVSAAAQDEVQIKTTPLRGGISMLQGQGGNLGVSAGEDGVFLIDDQFAPLTDKIRAAIKALSAAPIRFVLNTHFHGDHTDGNENLGASGTLIVAHDNVRERLTSDQFIAFFNNKMEAYSKTALPVVTFNDTVTFHLNGEEIHAFHVGPSAHTDGDSIVHFRKTNVVHMGDIFFHTMYPFIDVPNGGSVDGVIAAANQVLEMADADTQIIPGHGPLASKADLVVYRDMLQAIRDNVAALIAEGKSQEEVLAAKPSADFDEQWGQSFIPPDGIVGFVYASLTP